MNLIRPLERADLPEVTALYELVARSGRSTPPPGLAPFFERVLLDQPWADPEIPSLVHLDDTGAIVAFQGSSVRRARFDGRPIKIACAGQFVAHPAARRRAVGALLLRTYLGGAQALTITDTAGSARMREIWRLCGGEMLPAACIDWFRFLRPLASAEWYLRARRNAWRQRRGGRLLEVLDAAATRTIGFMSPPPAPDSTAQPLTAAGLVEHLPVVCGRVRLHLDYDERFVAWLLKELAEVSGLGTPVAHLVREQGGRVLGWYVYYSPPNGVCQVLQVAAAGQDVGRVLDHLLHDAWTRGAIAISGRIEPQLMEPLAQRRFVMRWAGGAALVHSRDAQILYAITSGRSLLTRLDGEWWIQDNEVDLGAPA